MAVISALLLVVFLVVQEDPFQEVEDKVPPVEPRFLGVP